MEKVILKKTDLHVSRIALGTADYGTKYSETDSFLQMDSFFENGGNFIDTALVYGSWVPNKQNASEQVVGNWMKSKRNRADIIISTKGAHPNLEDMDKSRVYPVEIAKDICESLLGLQTDYIDLYFLHRDNPKVPVVELLGCLEEEVKKGKIRYYGCSNWTLPRIVEAQQVAKCEGFKGFVCNQVMYSLATINKDSLYDPSLVTMDCETYKNHAKEEMNVMAFSAIAKGYLVKKVYGLQLTESIEKMYYTTSNQQLISYMKELENVGYKPYDVCMAYLTNQKLLTIPVVSFSGREQLEMAVRSSEITLPENIMKQLEQLRHGV